MMIDESATLRFDHVELNESIQSLQEPVDFPEEIAQQVNFFDRIHNVIR